MDNFDPPVLDFKDIRRCRTALAKVNPDAISDPATREVVISLKDAMREIIDSFTP